MLMQTLSVRALARCKDGSAGRQPEGFRQIARVGDFHLQFFARTESAGLQLLHVLGFVDKQDVLVGGGLGLEEIVGVGDAGGDEAVANAAIFFRGEDVLADGQEIGVAVDELEGEHGAIG